MLPQFETAYAAAQQAFVAMSVRQLLATEAEDPAVGGIVVECRPDGVDVTLLGKDGAPVGGYSL